MDKNTPGGAFVAAVTIKYAPGLMMISVVESVLKQFAQNLGLTPKRHIFQMYGDDVRAFTSLWFLEESHVILETYPEDGIVELQLGSCKAIDRERFYAAIEFFFGPVVGQPVDAMKTSKGWFAFI